MTPEPGKTIAAGAAYFASVFAAGFILGTVRMFVLAPRFGSTAATLIEMPVILVISWLICGWLIGRFGIPARASARLLMGAVAFGLLMAAEFMLATALLGETPGAFLHRFGDIDRALGLAGQLVFAAFPVLRLRFEHTR